MQKARSKLKLPPKKAGKQNAQVKHSSQVLHDYTDWGQLSIDHENAEQQAQAHLNYLSELDINVATGNDRGEWNNTNSIDGWWTTDERNPQRHCLQRRPAKSSAANPLERCSNQTQLKPDSTNSNQQKHSKTDSKSQSYKHHQRRHTTQFETCNTIQQRASPMCSHTVFIVDEPQIIRQMRTRSSSASHTNTEIAQLINRTLLRKKRKYLQADRVQWQLQLAKERANRRQSTIKRSSKKKCQAADMMICPRTLVLLHPQQETLVKLNQFMRQLAGQNQGDRVFTGPSVSHKPYPRKRTRCQPKSSLDRQLKSTTTESFANNRLVRQLYLKYDDIISRGPKRQFGL